MLFSHPSAVLPQASGANKTHESYLLFTVAPAKAGAQGLRRSICCPWVPAFAGMTKGKGGYQALGSYHYRSSHTSSMRQPLNWLLTIMVSPLTCGCMQVARRVW
jgi:hypothetical protein